MVSQEFSSLTLRSSSSYLWWQEGVIYQIYLPSFQDGNGDGLGDLAGIIKRLDYLAFTLGVTALWITPFYPSPMADGGYDVADYCEVDPRFGSLATFDRLIAEAHTRNLRVIIDFVPNHTSEQHPWFKESRRSRHNPYRDWYVWADARPDGSPPNNWLSVFGGSAWNWEAATEQYYLHSFLPQQPDLNWRNPAVKAAMLEVLRFWLARGVDGFRIDVAHFIMKDPFLRDNPPNLSGLPAFWRPFGSYDSQLHLFDQGHPDIHLLYREIRELVDSYSRGGPGPRLIIGELHRPDLGAWAAYYGRDLDELHLPFNFRLMAVPWTAQAIRRIVEEVEAGIPSGAWPNYVLGNHDEPRVASRLGPRQDRLAMVLLLTLRGTPTLYYGDELGMPNMSVPPEKARDHWESRLPGMSLGRDQERTPMLWDTSENAGFCPPEIQSWLPISLEKGPGSVATQLTAPASMLNLTRRLLKLRRAEPALSVGSYRSVASQAEECFCYVREYEGQRFLIALNFGKAEKLVDLTASGRSRGRLILSTGLFRQGEELELAQVALQAGEGCLIQLEG
jgi:alpha-glucosidase